MSPEHFAYWLQGFVELNKGAPPTPEQWKSITEHLGMVFTKVTPPVGIIPDHMKSTAAPIPDIASFQFCMKCGAPANNHPYRHPFVGAKTSDDILKARARHEEYERTKDKQFSPRVAIPSGIYPGRIC